MPDDAPTRYFDACSDAYAAARPSYPEAILSAALPHQPPIDAVDVGCGTGIATRGLARLGVNVIGLDPSPSMLASASSVDDAPSGRVQFREGTAEDTGLPAASADLVLVAQAFHWFDASAALAEFARILRPAGQVALLWNVREAANDFMRGYEDLVERAQSLAAKSGKVVPPNRAFETPAAPHFQIAKRVTAANPQFLDEASLQRRLRSASYWPPAGPPRVELEHDLSALFAEHATHGKVALTQSAQLTVLRRVTEP